MPKKMNAGESETKKTERRIKIRQMGVEKDKDYTPSKNKKGRQKCIRQKEEGERDEWP